MKTIAAIVFFAMAACGAAAGEVVHEATFGQQPPTGWRLEGDWASATTGAKADGACTASWSGELPENALVEMILDLPDTAALDKTASVSLSIGSGSDDPALVTASCTYQKTNFNATISGADRENEKVTVSASGDTRPSVLLENGEAEQHPGWASETVSLGVVLRQNDCRLMLNGSEIERAALSVPAERKLVLAANGVTVRCGRVLSAPPAGYAYVSGAGVAMRSGGLASRAATGIGTGKMESLQIDALGIPMIVQTAPEGMITLDVGAERFAPTKYNQAFCGEGIGFLKAPIPSGIYSAAYLLLYRGISADTQAAMGFGLRPPGRNAGELKNVYIGDMPESAADEGVSVRPVPALGQGWFLARVPLNPATLQWYRDGAIFPGETGSKHPRVHLYACRPWSLPSPVPNKNEVVPTPHGKPSSLHLAAVSLEESGIDLALTGNGLGNVFCEPDTPAISATLRNLTDRPMRARVTCELLPFERPARTKRRMVVLEPNGSVTFDALATKVRERGHYRVRVVADARQAGRVEYRTNLALLAPDTRKKVNSPFGIWPGTWGDESTETQRSYLVDKLGVGLLRNQISYYGVGAWENVSHVPRPIPDDAAAEEFVRQQSPQLRYFMLGWECNWPGWAVGTLFGFPRVISEGRPEVETPEVSAEADKCAETWRRLVRALRKLRPDVKISLGNSAVNFLVPLLERGFKHGVEFDYLGTEEPLVYALPEQPADAVANINWWTKAVCDHYGFHDVPVFKGEAFYYGTGPGFSRMSARAQAANYVRVHLLGFPYNAVFGMPATSVDSSLGYAYTLWGSAGYCNQGPECSPKPSYVAYATLTQMLDGARYDGILDAGTTSVYAMRFRKSDGSFLYALWNLRGSRRIEAVVAPGGHPRVTDTFNREVPAKIESGKMNLVISDLPIYVTGATLTGVIPLENIPQPEPQGILVARLDDSGDWIEDTTRDTALEAPIEEWRGMPRVKGNWSIGTVEIAVAPNMPVGGHLRALSFRLNPQEKPHGLIPRYVSLSAKPGKEIQVPKGTTRLGLWLYGKSTWAEVKIGVTDVPSGESWLILQGDTSSRMADNFDGWRFVDTGDLGEDVANGSCVIDRLVVTMPQQQVYVKDLLTTVDPEIAVWGITAIIGKNPTYTYLPW